MARFTSKKQTVKYIKKNGPSLPIYECWGTEAWEDHGMGTFLLSRQMPSGNLVIAAFIVDTFCLGIKGAFYQVNIDDSEYEDIKSKIGMVEKIDPSHFHNIVYGAHDFAEDYGFEPHKDFAVAEYLLNPDLITDEIEELEFGYQGLPHYIQGPHDSLPFVNKVIRTLKQTAGEGNFRFTNPAQM